LSYAVWHWVFQVKSHGQYTLPYNTQSPISKEYKDFDSVDDIWQEIISIEDSGKFSLGQQLFYLLPLFANPNYVISDEYVSAINEYFYVTEYNIPLGKTLDDTDAHKLSQFNIIKNEMAIANQHKANKNGRTKS